MHSKESWFFLLLTSLGRLVSTKCGYKYELVKGATGIIKFCAKKKTILEMVIKRLAILDCCVRVCGAYANRETEAHIPKHRFKFLSEK